MRFTMVRYIKQINEYTFRASYGRYYEDFEVKHIYQHRPGRTITEADNIWFSLLTMNTHPIHFDNEYGKGTEFGRALVASGFTVAVLGGMSVSDVSQKAIANLGWTDIKMLAPLFVGDTLYAESEVLHKRESKSRHNAGIVTIKTWGKNQDGIVVCEYQRTILVPKRGHAVEDKIDY
jgi:itaconyl-CoA hydratase